MLSFRAFTDAGTYAAYRPTTDTAEQLHEFVSNLGIPSLVEPNEYHITTVYSRVSIPYEPDKDGPFTVDPSHYEYLGREGDDPVLVLRVESPKLHERFDCARELGATWDFPSFKPHITLTNKMSVKPKVRLDHLPLPTFPLVMGDEYTQALDD